MAADGSIQRAFQIKNRLGLHARAAVQFVQLVNAFDADIRVAKDGRVVNGKSVIELMMLAAAQGSWIEVLAGGPQAAEAVEAIGALIDRCFDEGE